MSVVSTPREIVTNEEDIGKEEIVHPLQETPTWSVTTGRVLGLASNAVKAALSMYGSVCNCTETSGSERNFIASLQTKVTLYEASDPILGSTVGTVDEKRVVETSLRLSKGHSVQAYEAMTAT